MKNVISKLLLGSALLFASHVFAQDNTEAKFVPDANANPVNMAENNGIKATYTLGTIDRYKAFAVSFQNTNNKPAIMVVYWKIILTGKGLFYTGIPLKLKPGQTLDLTNNKNPNRKLAFVIKTGTDMERYKMKMRTLLITPDTLASN